MTSKTMTVSLRNWIAQRGWLCDSDLARMISDRYVIRWSGGNGLQPAERLISALSAGLLLVALERELERRMTGEPSRDEGLLMWFRLELDAVRRLCVVVPETGDGPRPTE